MAMELVCQAARDQIEDRCGLRAVPSTLEQLGEGRWGAPAAPEYTVRRPPIRWLTCGNGEDRDWTGTPAESGARDQDGRGRGRCAGVHGARLAEVL